MADFDIVPVPVNDGLGVGFWKDLQNDVQTASDIFEANTVSDPADESSDSSSGATFAYDPDVTTVTEFLTGIASMIAQKQDL